MWEFAAAVCLNDKNELLMVLQAYKDEDKKWSVPSGRKKLDETFRECCVRETFEETGYIVSIDSEIYLKKIIAFGEEAPVKYYKATVTGGKRCIQDPDELIYDIQWISKKQLKDLTLSFPEDRAFLLGLME